MSEGMSAARLLGLVGQNLRRNGRNLVFSSVGIVVGISTFVFFVALGQGIKTVVLEEIFVIRQLEVVPRTFKVGAFETEGGLFGGGPTLDEATAAELGRLPGVAGVYPKMRLTFPASAYGGKELLGKNFYTELIADGVDPALVAGDLEPGVVFADLEGEAQACGAQAPCPAGSRCEGAVCQKQACTPAKLDGRGRPEGDGDCPGGSFCAPDTGRCEAPIPAVLNPRLLEIYNGSVHTAMKGARGALSKLPRLTGDALKGITVYGTMGRSYLGEASQGEAVTRKFVLVGFSDKAIGLGATMPIGYVQRLNARFGGEGASRSYHSILVETRSNEAVPAVAQSIEEMGFALDDKYEDAQRAGLVISIVTGIFSLISVIIILIAAINIMHTFLMIIMERRKEIGLMRALGATRAGIRAMILVEAAAVGLLGGGLGCVLGVLAALGVDAAFAAWTPAFPFKPVTLFAWEPWFFVAGLGGAALFCLLGALVPAVRASRMDPAAALTGG